MTVSALPARNDLALYAGDDFTMTVDVNNPDGSAMNLAGYTTAAQIRTTAADANVLASFTSSIDAANGVITLTLPHTATASLPLSTVYDCQIVSAAGWITTLTAGNIVTTADVTRP